MYVVLVPFYSNPHGTPDYEVMGPFHSEADAKEASKNIPDKYCLVREILSYEFLFPAK